MTYYGGEGDARCLCDKSVERRMACPYHLFRDLNVARRRGVEYNAAFVKVRMEVESNG